MVKEMQVRMQANQGKGRKLKLNFSIIGISGSQKFIQL